MSLFTIPKKFEKQTDYNFFFNAQPLDYAKKNDTVDEKKRMIVNEAPVALACSKYHYYILHKDCLTILSRLNGKVVTYVDVRFLVE